MAQITNPFNTDLTRVDPDAIDQPRPPDPPIRTASEQIPVEAGCDVCGCRWVVEYDVPEGSTVCGFCNADRGYVGRNASLDEFSDDHDDGPETIGYAWAGESPLPDWETIFDNTRLLVQVDPTASFVDELGELLVRSPYEMDVYLRTATNRLSENAK